MSPTPSPKTAGLFLLVVACCAGAQEPLASPHDDRFRLSAGIYSMSSDTRIRLDADDGTPGTELVAEDDLGLRERSEVGNVEVDLRIRQRHHMRFNYFQSDRRATMTLEEPIQFGNDVYVIGDTVESRLDVRNFTASYAFEFLRYERVSLGVSAGINLIEFRANAAVAARRISEEESRTGPFPSVGLHTLVRISDRFHLEARGEYMSVEVDDYEGDLVNVHAALLYRFNRNFGLGLGYNSIDYEVRSQRESETGRISLGNAGGELFLRVSF